jgi:hypothetical protein
MKRIWKGLIVIAFVFLISPLAEAQLACPELVAGWEAFQRMQAGQASPSESRAASIYVGYIYGIADAAFYYRSASGQITVKDAGYVVGKFLDEHPERLHGPAIYLVVEALSQAFPQFPTTKYR